MENLSRLYNRIHTLVIFSSVLEDKAVKKLLGLLEYLQKINHPVRKVGMITNAKDESTSDEQGLEFTTALRYYSELAGELYAKSEGNLSEHILNLVLEDQNVYSKFVSQKKAILPSLEKCLAEELDILSEFSSLKSVIFKEKIGYDGYLLEYDVKSYDFHQIYKKRIAQIHHRGFGIFAKYSTFVIESDNIIPVQNPDNTKLFDLTGYSSQRRQIIDNTKALLGGKSAANMLMYGDAGTGKSATVKALASNFFEDGLRLIELKKSQYSRIPKLMDSLGSNPLKFILFLDDLSFNKDDDDFSSLKAILEGSVSAKSDNIVIYATSNRRHFVKENFSDREGDEIHFSDTMEEISSLSDRFGLTVTFSKPNKEEYIKIMLDMAEKIGIETPEEQLVIKAEAFAIRRGGRSPRVAKHFVELFSSGVIN
ncbi:MAG: DUF815 domain-containing protein [Proteocatella sp.]